MRIFIADDEPSVIDVLAHVCVREGHSVASASSSLEAIDFLTKNAVDLLVVDVTMSAPEGLQVIREARTAQPNLMTIAMTGYQGRYSLNEVQSAGANDVIYKPLRVDEFRARVAFAEQRRRVIEGLNSRRRELQQMSATMLKAVQGELDDVRKALRRSTDTRVGKPADTKA